MISDFDAFALYDTPTPELALLHFEERGLRVRYVDASSEWIAEVVDSLLAAREALVGRSVLDIAAVLGRVGARFLDDGDPLRAEALRLLPPTSSLSPEMARAVLDGMASDWTGDRLMGLLRSELRDTTSLDRFVHPREAPRRGGGSVVGEGAIAGAPAVFAVGPTLCVQIVAGSVPGVGVSALLRSLLLKGPTLLKPGRGDIALPVLFARALREADPALAAALAVVYWPGGMPELEQAALARADVVTAYGSDETVADLRSLTPVTARFVGYHHRVSVGVVGQEALTPDRVEATAAEVAEAVALFDQRGCVSPQVVFVEEAGVGSEGVPSASPAAAAEFATALAEALEGLEARLPSGELDDAEASALHQLRGTAELMAATGRIAVMHGGGHPWTVIVESEGSPLGSCPGRLVYVRPVSDLEDLPGRLSGLGPHLQTVGVAGLGDRLGSVARALGRVGASRVVPFRSVAFPPPWWHHDGRGPLLDLVRWVDLQTE